MGKAESVDFVVSPFFHYNVTNTTSAVDANENMSVGAGIFQRGIATAVAWEPSKARTLGQLRFDANTRLIVMHSREAGIGAATPVGSLRLSRIDAVDELIIPLGDVLVSAAAVPQVFDGVIPVTLGTLQTSPTIDDAVICEYFVDPNEAVAHVVSCTVLFVPSLELVSTGRGNILSGSAYY